MVKSFSEFINESQELSFEELSQLVELGLMASEDARAELRKQMKARIKPGTSPFDEINYEELKASPTIQATRLPEMQPYLDAGFRPASSIQQIVGGTLYLTRENSAGVYFFAQSKYIRKDGTDRMQVIAKDIPGEGLEFYRNAMKFVSDKYDLNTGDITTKANSARRDLYYEAVQATKIELRRVLPQEDIFQEDYVAYLCKHRKGPALAKAIEQIRQTSPSLPLYTAEDFYRARDWVKRAEFISRGRPVDVKFFAAVPMQIRYWHRTSLDDLKSQDRWDESLSKPLTFL